MGAVERMALSWTKRPGPVRRRFEWNTSLLFSRVTEWDHFRAGRPENLLGERVLQKRETERRMGRARNLGRNPFRPGNPGFVVERERDFWF